MECILLECISLECILWSAYHWSAYCGLDIMECILLECILLECILWSAYHWSAYCGLDIMEWMSSVYYRLDINVDNFVLECPPEYIPHIYKWLKNDISVILGQIK